MAGDRLTLRSYRAAFELERRIHRIDRFRIPVPYGIPLVGLGYWFAALVGVALLGQVPLAGRVLAETPWPLRVLLLPGVAAHLLCRRTSDGRPSHAALAARALRAARSVMPSADRRAPRLHWIEPVVVVADERGTEYVRSVVRGPAHVVLRRPARGTVRGRRLELVPAEGAPLYQGQTVRLVKGQRLVIR